MKIVKRDGRTVDYNPDKIKLAIGKANNEVQSSDKIDDQDIDKIIMYIESLNKKRMLVEDIQDIIEEKLMEMQKFNLAKKYIIYRYTRSIIRKSNTTDASILSLLKNEDVNSGNYLVSYRQRDMMAGEASKDLAFRLLLPNNVVQAHKSGFINFCNVEYFTEPIIESLKISLKEILKDGTVLNGVKIEKPKGFQSACNILIEVIASLASAQTGAIYLDFSELFEYYYLSYDKQYKLYSTILGKSISDEEISALTRTQTFLEVVSGIQTLIYQINTITLASGLVPKVYFLVDPKACKDSFEEQIMLELLKQRRRGILLDDNTIRDYPLIVYCYNFEERYQYLNEEALKIGTKSIIMNAETYDSFVDEISRFNQGSIILNLPSIAKDAASNNKDFLEELEKVLGYCYEGMLCRNHNLQGIFSDKSPIHWQYGGIAKLKKSEKIDNFLKKEYSFMNLVVLGLENATHILGSQVKMDIIKKIENSVKVWNQSSSFDVRLSNFYDENTINELFKKDEEYLSKYEINKTYDSLDFIKSGYFKSNFIYLPLLENYENVESIIRENNYFVIYKK